MNFVLKSQWLHRSMLLIACASVHTQYAMPYQMQQQYQFPGPPRPPPPPMPMPPPPMPMPPPYPPNMAIARSMMAVPAGYAVIIPEDFSRGKQRKTSTTTTTTTTTTRPPTRPFRIIPIQMMPPPMVPAPMMPGPMMMQGPAMMMPSPMMLLNYPSNPKRRRRKHWGGRHSGSSSSSCSSSREASCESLRVKSDSDQQRRWNTVTRRNNVRAYNRVPDVGVVKPVLSYVAPNGDVKFETKITNREAVSLLNGKDASIDFENDSLNHHEEPRKNVRVVTKRDKNNEQLVVYTEDEPAGSRSYRRSFHRVAVGSKPVQQYLQKGKKELIFNAPENKKITNMTLSFQVV